MPSAPGKLRSEGPKEIAAALSEALVAAQMQPGVSKDLTHGFHSYPGRMHPATARKLVALVASLGGKPPGLTILDPFCGSGTTLVEAKAAGLPSIGIDLNPLAVALSKAKTWGGSRSRRQELTTHARTLAGGVLAVGKAARRGGFEATPLRAPKGVNATVRNRELSRWFAPHVRRELEGIADGIEQTAAHDPELASVLRMVLSSILYKVSSRTSDTDPTWIQRSVARGAACRLFVDRSQELVRGLAAISSQAAVHVVAGDARQAESLLAERTPERAELAVVTSPPYAGIYDYAEHHQLRATFLGLSLRPIRQGEIGARRNQGPTGRGERWRDQLASMLASIGGVIGSGRHAAIVIGDSLANGLPCFALDDVRAALPPTLAFVAAASQRRMAVSADERSGFSSRGKYEHVILLRRVPQR